MAFLRMMAFGHYSEEGHLMAGSLVTLLFSTKVLYSSTYSSIISSG